MDQDQKFNVFTSKKEPNVSQQEGDRSTDNHFVGQHAVGGGGGGLERIMEGTTSTTSPLSSPPPSLFAVTSVGGGGFQQPRFSPMRLQQEHHNTTTTFSSTTGVTFPNGSASSSTPSSGRSTTTLLRSRHHHHHHPHLHHHERTQQEQQQPHPQGIALPSPYYYGPTTTSTNIQSPLMLEAPSRKQTPSPPPLFFSSSPPQENYNNKQETKLGAIPDRKSPSLPSTSSSASPSQRTKTRNDGDGKEQAPTSPIKKSGFPSFLPSRFTNRSSSKDDDDELELSEKKAATTRSTPSSSKGGAPTVATTATDKDDKKPFSSPFGGKFTSSLPVPNKPAAFKKTDRQTTTDSRVTFHPDNITSHTITSTQQPKKEIIVSYEDDASKLQVLFMKLHNRHIDGTKTWYELTRLLEHFYKDDPKRCRRSCERQRHITERTYLHAVLMNHPPVQIVRLLLKLSSATLQLVDYYGMTPLHIATNYTASYDVQECLVKEYPEALRIQDCFGRVPLHYVFDPLKLDDALARVQKNQTYYRRSVIGTLGSGAEDDDNEGNGFGFDDDEEEEHDDDRSAALDGSARPGTTMTGPSRRPNAFVGGGVVGGLTVKEARRLVGRQRGYYARVALLTVSEVIFIKDCHGKSPFRLYCRIAKSVRHNDSIFIDRMKRILLLLLDSDPLDSHEELIVELRHLPYQLLDVAITHPLTHGVVNAKTSHSIFASLFMLDLAVQVILIVGFTYVVTATVWITKGDVPDTTNDGSIQGGEETHWHLKPLEARAVVLLCVGLGISILRQGLEIAASISRHNFRRWISDFWNLLSVFNIWLVLTATSQLVHQKLEVVENNTYYLTLVAGGIQWVSLITILRLAWLPFCIFVTGTLRVAEGLIPYLVVSFFLMGAYAFMFYIGTIDECNKAGIMPSDTTRVNDEFTCTFRGSILTMFDWRFGSGIPREAFYSFSSDITILTIVFCIIFTILMAHVLIAMVVDAYLNAKESGIQMFWRFRFEGLANAEAIRSITRRITIDLFGNGRLGNSSSKEMLELWWDSAIRTLSSHLVVPNPRRTQQQRKAASAKNVLVTNDVASSGFTKQQQATATMTTQQYYRAKLCHCLKKCILLLGMAVWCIAGLLTLGILWPPQVIDYLFCPQCTSQDYQTAASQKKAMEKQQQKEAEQFDLLKQRMEHLEDLSEELRAIQLRLTKDLRETRKGFNDEMKYMSNQMVTLQESVDKMSQMLMENSKSSNGSP